MLFMIIDIEIKLLDKFLHFSIHVRKQHKAISII
jgi:hypothetical protein